MHGARCVIITPSNRRPLLTMLSPAPAEQGHADLFELTTILRPSAPIKSLCSIKIRSQGLERTHSVESNRLRSVVANCRPSFERCVFAVHSLSERASILRHKPLSNDYDVVPQFLSMLAFNQAFPSHLSARPLYPRLIR